MINVESQSIQSFGYLAEDTLINTPKGDIPIHNIQIGDEVLTHMARPRKVIQIHKKLLSDKQQLYRINYYGNNKEHKVCNLYIQKLKDAYKNYYLHNKKDTNLLIDECHYSTINTCDLCVEQLHLSCKSFYEEMRDGLIEDNCKLNLNYDCRHNFIVSTGNLKLYTKKNQNKKDRCKEKENKCKEIEYKDEWLRVDELVANSHMLKSTKLDHSFNCPRLGILSKNMISRYNGIISVEPVDYKPGYIYALEVEDYNSYSVNNVITQNF